MKKVILVILVFFNSISAYCSEQPVRVSDFVQNESVTAYPAAVYQEAHIVGKCDSNSVKKRAHWLQAGVEKKRIDSQWKTDQMKFTIETTKVTEVYAYDELGRPLTRITEAQKPTEATNNFIRSEELKAERVGKEIERFLGPVGVLGAGLLFK